jgi:hypothetical protein
MTYTSKKKVATCRSTHNQSKNISCEFIKPYNCYSITDKLYNLNIYMHVIVTEVTTLNIKIIVLKYFFFKLRRLLHLGGLNQADTSLSVDKFR